MPVFNSFLFNQGTYNGGTVLAPVYLTDFVVFDDFSISDNVNFFVENIDDSGPAREFLGAAVPNDDGEFLSDDLWRKKTITVKGHLITTSALLMRQFMDTMRKNLRNPEAYLDITEQGMIRRHVASLANMASLFPRREHYYITHLPFTAQFEIKSGFAADRVESSQNILIETSPANDILTNSGTYKALPTFVLAINAANTMTVLNIQIDETDAEIQVTSSFAAGDVLVIDCEAQTVKKNGVEVDFSGSFPKLDVGDNTVRYTVTSVSHTIRATIIYKQRYF